MSEFFAVIEAGGTKFNCAIMDGQRNILAEQRIPTTTPDETLGAVTTFFTLQRQQGYAFDLLGLGCFGPLDLRTDSPTYGAITNTPKLQWVNTAIADLLEHSLNCRVVIDTDVNAAAMAEYKWGAAQHSHVCVYVTVGTGVGGGVLVNGQPLHGLVHPEIGHMLIPPPKGIQGVCPYHGNCVEGLASGTAMGKIWQQPAETLSDDHQAWAIQAQVLAKLCHNLLVNLSAEKIILGGGVMNKPGLLEDVIQFTELSLKGYVKWPDNISLSDIICLPGLGERSGLYGALALINPSLG